MKKIICALLLCQSAHSAPELKGHPDELKGFLKPEVTKISIVGSSEKSAYSDQAIVSVLVTTDEESLSASIKANNTVRSKFISAMVSSGIDPDKINNSKFSSSPQYGWFGKKPDSYKVVNRLSIEISTEKDLQKIAEYTDKSSELTFSGVQFEHSKEDEYEKRVKEEALKKVMEKKSFYEKNLKLKLTPISFQEHNVGHYPTEGANQVEEVIVTGIRSDSSYSKSRSTLPIRKSTFDEVKYSASVTVEFKVEDGG